MLHGYLYSAALGPGQADNLVFLLLTLNLFCFSANRILHALKPFRNYGQAVREASHCRYRRIGILGLSYNSLRFPLHYFLYTVAEKMRDDQLCTKIYEIIRKGAQLHQIRVYIHESPQSKIIA